MHVLARSFDASILKQIAEQAEHNAALIIELERKPWRRSAIQNDALDTFQQLAAYCNRVIAMQDETP